MIDVVHHHVRHNQVVAGVIYTIAYSPDGKLLATAGFGDKVQIFDAEGGQMLREMPAPGNDIRAIAFSPDGTRLAAAGRSGLLRIWQSDNGQQVADVQVSARRISALAYSSDGKLLAVGGRQRVVRLLNGSTGKPEGDMPERPGEVFSLCFCGPDMLVSAGSGNVIHLWDIGSRQERSRLVGHTGSVTTMFFQADTKTLVSGSYDTTVRLWDLAASSQDKVTRR